MSDTMIVGDTVGVVQTGNAGRSAFSWNPAIAGALAAIAASFILYSLGTGIGLTLVSPYSNSNPSPSTMTAIGAIWLVLSQALSFAVGGYMAGRLRIRSHIPGDETRFRDAAHGFMAWAIGVLISALILGVVTASAVSGTGRTLGDMAAGATSNATANVSAQDPFGYYVDALFRPDAQGGAPPTAAAAAAGQAPREEVGRIVAAGIKQGRLDDADKRYLGSLVAQRTGMTQEQALSRVNSVEAQAINATQQAAETARKTAAYASFWTFMALLFGAVAAILAGMLGGELRDDMWNPTGAEERWPQRA